MRPGPHGLYDPSFEHDACGMGFVAHIRGEKSRDIIEQGLEILDRMSHRGAVGADPETGDGAGILLQIPHRFFKAEGLRLGFEMPRRRRYGIGQVFLPPDADQRRACMQILEEAIAEEGQRVIGWRDVPVDAPRRRPRRPRRHAGHPAGLRRHGPRPAERVRAQALRDPQARREPHPRQ